MIKRIKQWYNGSMVTGDFEKTGIPHEDIQMEFLHMRIHRHWTANLARQIVALHRGNAVNFWIMVFTAIAAIAGLIAAFG